MGEKNQCQVFSESRTKHNGRRKNLFLVHNHSNSNRAERRVGRRCVRDAGSSEEDWNGLKDGWNSETLHLRSNRNRIKKDYTENSSKLLKGKFRSSSVRSAPGVGYHHNVKLKLYIMFLICYSQTAVGDFLNFS